MTIAAQQQIAARRPSEMLTQNKEARFLARPVRKEKRNEYEYRTVSVPRHCLARGPATGRSANSHAPLSRFADFHDSGSSRPIADLTSRPPGRGCRSTSVSSLSVVA